MIQSAYLCSLSAAALANILPKHRNFEYATQFSNRFVERVR